MSENRKMPELIAIVDDDEPLREALGSVMKAAGFRTRSFGSAEEFLNPAALAETACLILDVRLPGISGVELQRRLLEEGRRIPIIFISAHGDASLRDLVMKSGAAGFLNKPVRSEALLKDIHTALRNAQKDRESD